ncbi:MAG: Asp-tRNA(Asn)/Glu-tRNA(Gln) amidotransferase subunit GatC, partial [Fibrobacterota bacterium]
MKITREQVLHIAKLSHLELTDAETEACQKELSAILDYVDTLNQADTNGVEPQEHAFPQPTFYRADEVIPSLPNAALL